MTAILNVDLSVNGSTIGQTFHMKLPKSVKLFVYMNSADDQYTLVGTDIISETMSEDGKGKYSFLQKSSLTKKVVKVLLVKFL